ncbi:MAG: hypothetical protein CM15mP73_2930 [Hyphomicrobiales bacterium]|nr:MAG: hypothetical protein CM15mP73_2930 [Hyphomicrobiales bacterium]
MGCGFHLKEKCFKKQLTQSQVYVTGEISLKLHKGNIIVMNRKSDYSLYNADLVSFEDTDTDYNQNDAGGFIKINSLRLKLLSNRKK